MFRKLFVVLIIYSVLSLNCIQNNKEKRTVVSEANTELLYTQHCASCHGEKMQAFVDREWRHGSSRNELMESISAGYIKREMPSFKELMDSAQIGSMADLILKYKKNVDQYQVGPKPTSNIFISQRMKIKLDTVAAGFGSPWGFAQLPNGNYLITDRDGILYLIDKKKNKTSIKNTPLVLAEGQGGLLDIALHPNYAKNGWIYLSYSKSKNENGQILSTTAIVRGKIKDNSFVDVHELFEAQPYAETRHHYGSRIVFDKKGYLYFSVGERGKEKNFPQSIENDNGKIHRLKDDGTIPSDNPFVNIPNSRKSIYCYGNRNPQGLVLNKETGEIWEHEHGPRGGDEVNIIHKGANYGWPVICYGINYNEKPITNISKKEGMEQPEIYWTPSIAPSGMAFVTGDKYPAWKGNLMAGSLRFNYLNRCILTNNKITSQERILLNIGRMRNVKMGNDGYLYISIENPGMVFRLVPM